MNRRKVQEPEVTAKVEVAVGAHIAMAARSRRVEHNGRSGRQLCPVGILHDTSGLMARNERAAPAHPPNVAFPIDMYVGGADRY
jgi:hypothetical protein